MRALITSLAVTAFALTCTMPSSAHAAPGDLTFSGCIADTNAEGCVVGFQDSLDGASNVAVSPNGTSVYVTSRQDDSVSHFTRSPDGALNFAGCYADTAAEGCLVPSKPVLDGVSGVAVSPDGNSVYVSASRDDAVSHFRVLDGGGLDFVDCDADSDDDGCTVGFQASLDGARGLAVSPDGSSVYVASSGDDDSVSHFTRVPDGRLTFAGCIADTAVEGCVTPSEPAMDGAIDVVVSPDGSSVYVASINDDAVSHFRTLAGGGLEFVDCDADSTVDGCAVGFQDSLEGARGLAISPDGSSVYVVSSEVDDTVSHFTRAPDGALSFAGCIGDTAAEGCIVPPKPALSSATEVAVSPDGNSVYVTASDDNSLTHFSRAASGAISFVDCDADSAVDGCAVGFQKSLAGAQGLAVSPDGSSVYVASEDDSAVSHFTRELFPSAIPPGGNPPTDNPPGSGTPALELRVPAKTKLDAGDRARLEAEVVNTGTATAVGVEVCLRAPKKAKGEVKANMCKALGDLLAGGELSKKLKVKTTKNADGSYKLNLTATATGTEPAGAKAKLKIAG